MGKLSILSTAVAAFFLVASVPPVPAFAADADGSGIFIAGFTAYQKKEYAAAVLQLNTLLKKYPNSSMRDMALLWLAKGYFKKGDRAEGARLMAQFLREYPESPLIPTVDQEMRDLAALYAKGEPLPAPRAAAPSTGQPAAGTVPLNAPTPHPSPSTVQGCEPPSSSCPSP